MKYKIFTLSLCLMLNGLLFAQPPTVNMELIKNQSYMANAYRVNCADHQGSTLELRICANLELQRQDSLLQVQLQALLQDYRSSGDTVAAKQLNHAQTLWEQYRFAHCYTGGEGHSAEMIAYMQCLAEVTRHRREELDFSNE